MSDSRSYSGAVYSDVDRDELVSDLRDAGMDGIKDIRSCTLEELGTGYYLTDDEAIELSSLKKKLDMYAPSLRDRSISKSDYYGEFRPALERFRSLFERIERRGR